MEIKEAEAIKAAEILRQYCGDVHCTDCIFYFRNDCMLSDTRNWKPYECDEYTPNDWRVDLVKGEQFHEFNEVK